MNKKYMLIDLLEDLSQVQFMVELHSKNSNTFMFSQYREIRKRTIKEFNKISNGKKVSKY